MIVEGIVASEVGVSEKGCGFKVMCLELGDTFRMFVPKERLNGEQLLRMGNKVRVDLKRFFPVGNEVRMDVNHVSLLVEKK